MENRLKLFNAYVLMNIVPRTSDKKNIVLALRYGNVQHRPCGVVLRETLVCYRMILGQLDVFEIQ